MEEKRLRCTAVAAGVVDTVGHGHIPTHLVGKVTAQLAVETDLVLDSGELPGALDPPQACQPLMRGRAGNQTSGHIPQWRAEVKEGFWVGLKATGITS